MYYENLIFLAKVIFYQNEPIQIESFDDDKGNFLLISFLDFVVFEFLNEENAKIAESVINGSSFSSDVIKILKWPIIISSPSERIRYDIKYESILKTDYIHKLGEDGFIYTREDIISKQRSVATYFIKKVGMNLLKGKSIMNISLPINIFDKRTLLDQWVWQNGLSSKILEKALPDLPPIEKIKYTTVFALSKFLLSGAPLKPFNPILGETFQAKLEKTEYYLEQTSHHPPLINFYAKGENYKIYGYEQPDASTSPNSVTVYYKGNLTVEFNDEKKTKNVVIYPTIVLGGTMVGTRKLKFKGKMCVYDKENDLISLIFICPEIESKGFLSRMIKSSTTDKNAFPDFFTGGIYRISDLNIENFDNNICEHIQIGKDVKELCMIKGEFTDHINFGTKTYWLFGDEKFPKIYRVGYLLPSDSFFRDDLIWFKLNELEVSQRFKEILEEKQRRDKKLREENQKKN